MNKQFFNKNLELNIINYIHTLVTCVGHIIQNLLYYAVGMCIWRNLGCLVHYENKIVLNAISFSSWYFYYGFFFYYNFNKCLIYLKNNVHTIFIYYLFYRFKNKVLFWLISKNPNSNLFCCFFFFNFKRKTRMLKWSLTSSLFMWIFQMYLHFGTKKLFNWIPPNTVCSSPVGFLPVPDKKEKVFYELPE